jgi:hypothetical protein
MKKTAFNEGEIWKARVKRREGNDDVSDGNLPLSSWASEISGELAIALQGEGERGLRCVSSWRRGDVGREQMTSREGGVRG